MAHLDHLSHPELRADGGFAAGSAHLQSLVSIPATNTLKQVIDEVKPERHTIETISLANIIHIRRNGDQQQLLQGGWMFKFKFR